MRRTNTNAVLKKWLYNPTCDTIKAMSGGEPCTIPPNSKVAFFDNCYLDERGMVTDQPIPITVNDAMHMTHQDRWGQEGLVVLEYDLQEANIKQQALRGLHAYKAYYQQRIRGLNRQVSDLRKGSGDHNLKIEDIVCDDASLEEFHNRPWVEIYQEKIDDADARMKNVDELVKGIKSLTPSSENSEVTDLQKQVTRQQDEIFILREKLKEMEGHNPDSVPRNRRPKKQEVA